MFKSKLIGGILFIVGTSIGGGMLVMPVSIATVGMFNSLVFLVGCWAVMTAGALLILEANLRLPRGSNLVSMAKSTLGLPGQLIAWVAYLVLLYTLLSAYISGGGEVLSELGAYVNLNLTSPQASVLFTLIFGFIIYKGMAVVDYVNRGLMFGKLGIYCVLICILSPHIQWTHLIGGSSRTITGSLMLLVTSFGFASIVPTLCDYFNQDVRLLRRSIIIGSLIPLLCYTIWIAVIMGVIQRAGTHGLIAIQNSQYTLPALTQALNISIGSRWINGFFSSFTSICMVTAFLGVSIGLFDFLADGLTVKKTGIPGKLLLVLTFLPPLAIVLFNPGLYLHAFNYAGICCVVLLLLLPTAMAWKARGLSNSKIMLPGGYISLCIVGLIAMLLLIIAWRTMNT